MTTRDYYNLKEIKSIPIVQVAQFLNLPHSAFIRKNMVNVAHYEKDEKVLDNLIGITKNQDVQMGNKPKTL